MIFPCPNPLSRLKAKFDLYYAKINHEHDLDYAPIDHNHDERYYTEAEVDALLDGKADDPHDHDERYYTEAEVDALIAGISGGAIVGEIRMWTNATPPSGWAICDGAIVQQSVYPELYAVIGDTFGEDPPPGYFYLPNLEGRFPFGAYGGIDPVELGDIGGEAQHTLTTSEMPSHKHLMYRSITKYLPSGSAIGYPGHSGGGEENYGEETEYAGSNQPHNNIPPYLGLHFIIYAGT